MFFRRVQREGVGDEVSAGGSLYVSQREAASELVRGLPQQDLSPEQEQLGPWRMKPPMLA